MAHIKVERESMPFDKWLLGEIERVDGLTVAMEAPTGPWEVREGRYDPDRSVWATDFQPIGEGDFWGAPDGTAQFRATVEIPPAMAGRKVWLSMLTGAEVLLHRDGELIDGLDPNRQLAVLTEQAEAGRRMELLLEAYTRSKPDDQRCLITKPLYGCAQRFRQPSLVVIDEEAEALRLDLKVLYAIAWNPAVPAELRDYLQEHFGELLKVFPVRDISTEAELRSALPRIREYVGRYMQRPASFLGPAGRLACLGHSHLDVAYHWTARQTVQKNARTCLLQLRLMEQYPEYLFGHSQPWCYEMLERYYPEVFERVRRRVAEGRWEPLGGMYVEPDGNLPSAEALCRQVAYGKRYFLDVFGLELDNCWLPDNFGNSAVLPQILRLGGIRYFVSHKPAVWYDTNDFPHSNFIWRGLDGSEVYVCIPPMHFNTWFNPDQLVNTWRGLKEKTVAGETLFTFGYGDGGSGPTRDLVELYRRYQEMPGMPRLRMSTCRDYLHGAFAEAEGRLDVWDDEFYCEGHRGAYTTKGRLKQENRQCEFLAADTEALCVLAALDGTAYPGRELEAAWKTVLTNQFHDILPGSHSEPVYHEAMAAYARARAGLQACREPALDTLAPRSAPRDLCLVNPLGDAQPGLAVLAETGELPERALARDREGEAYPLQRQVLPAGESRYVVACPSVPACSTRTLVLEESAEKPSAEGLIATLERLENRFFRLTLDARGRLVSLLDKRLDREVLAEGSAGNAWQMFQDKPGAYNAWDLVDRYRDSPVPLPDWESVDVAETGPLSAALRLRRGFGASRAEQIVRLHRDLPRVDFETWVDWRETEKILKVAFPVSVRSRRYRTDTTAGALERDNHRNTSWQAARFEVCCHQWVDLSEGLFGVALMNDCKYGCDVQEQTMRLTLLRAPIAPDPDSDKEEHRFTYSLFPHGGDWRRDGVTEAARALNRPVTAWRGRRGRAFEERPGLSLDTPALKLSALKQADDGSGDIVVRLTETYGSRGRAVLRAAFPFHSVSRCDLLERPGQTLETADGAVRVPYGPCQIQTLRFAS